MRAAKAKASLCIGINLADNQQEYSIDVMRGSRNFRQGGPGQFFLVLSLFYRSQMVNFKEIYHFSRFHRGSNIFQGGGVQIFPGGGGVQLLIPNRNPYNL